MLNTNAEEKGKNQLYITSYLSDTNVLVTVNNSSFKKELTMQGGKSETVEVPSDTELRGTGKYSKTVMIQSNKFITIVSSNQKKNSVDTSLVYPVTELGQEYYIFTPSATGYPKELAVFALQGSTSVTVELKCAVTFEDITYKPNEKLTTQISASEVLYLESNEDCTGSRVVSRKPVGVLSGHACAGKESRCQHTFEQLLPVENWGTSFIVSPLEFQSLQDSVFVFASQSTRFTYQFGPKSQISVLKAGQWKEIPIGRNPPLVISSDQPIQVLFYCNGGDLSDGSEFDPFIMNIVPTEKFCESYTLEGFTNYALIIAKTKDIKEVQFDDKHPSFNWQQVHQTEYSWAHYTYENGHHTLKSPSAPIGVYSVGTVDQNSYGTPAACGSLICTQNGQYYPPGKPFWDDSACTQLCDCNPSTGFVICQTSQCNAEEECKVIDGMSKCVANTILVPMNPPKDYIPKANGKGESENELYIVSDQPNTNVIVTINNSPFKEEMDLEGPKSVKVQVPPETEMEGTGKYSEITVVPSSKVITIVSSNQNDNSIDTSLVYPVNKWGQEYYVTPSAKGYPKELALFSGPDATSVTVELKCGVTLQGKTYQPGDKLTVSLGASEIEYLESNEDCTGSRVVSDKPVGVISGHACSWENSQCQPAFEQLLPVEQWGTSYIVTPLEYQVLTDSVYIFASKPTRVTYQFGEKSQDIDLSAGQWKEIPMGKSPPLVISSTQPIQVLYYCNGGKFSDSSAFDPFIMNIVPTDKFCQAHTLEGMEGFNYALIVAKTKDMKEVQFDDKRPSFKWEEVHGTEYSWTHYAYKKGRGHHVLMHPTAPIGVYSVGTANKNGYGAPAACALLTCSHNGQYHPAEKPFWEDSACTKQCKCNPSTGLVNCKESSCKAGEECKVIEGMSECVASTSPAPVNPPKGF
ncbi:IgGFc-binding protein-like [Conger conger]|uniref:IgGFc-binding protein-like n=1 Tax=Conger conger TaxID=82655 RepID=UPI002A59F98B|nr:IgGFc-binding protein-like [Conger conger]